MKKVHIAPRLSNYGPLSISRRHVLGDYYSRCERVIKPISVYLNDVAGEKLGFVDEGLGQYADAFTFHLSEDKCKMLAGGHFDYSFDYYFSQAADPVPLAISSRRIQLISIFLTERKIVNKLGLEIVQPANTAIVDQPDD
jgi:hypothetical protein